MSDAQLDAAIAAERPSAARRAKEAQLAKLVEDRKWVEWEARMDILRAAADKAAQEMIDRGLGWLRPLLAADPEVVRPIMECNPIGRWILGERNGWEPSPSNTGELRRLVHEVHEAGRTK